MATNKSLQISVAGAKEMRKALRDLGERQLLRELGGDNREMVAIVIRSAQALAGAGREAKVAGLLRNVNSANHVSVRLAQMVDVNDKRGSRPVGMGTEFGAYRNRRRLVKNTGGRHTIVREGEDISRVIRRVENQTTMRDRFGGSSTMPKRYRRVGATAVKVTKVIRGWNGFRPWRGNAGRAGYFLFPAIRRNRPQLIELYTRSIERVWTKHKAA